MRIGVGTMTGTSMDGVDAVATKIDGCMELVKDNKNGLLIPVQESLSLSYALEKLIHDKNLRLEMGANGRQSIEMEFSNEIINQKDYLRFSYNEQNYYYELKNYKHKMKTLKNLRKIFLNLKVNKQLQLLEIIAENKKRKNYSKICLNAEELKTLDKNSLITIGAHTHTHTNLKILNKDEAIYDICKCIKTLENLLKHKVKHFAYPYGGVDHVGHREHEIIKNLNFSSAVTDGVYPIKDGNLFSLPRIHVGKNANEKEINNHLTGFYNLAVKFM